MKVIAAYLLSVLGGNTSPGVDDLNNIIRSVGVEAEVDRIELLLSELKGKDITEVIAYVREKLASVPSGGGVAVAASACGGDGAAPAAAETKKEEEVEEKEESDDINMESFNSSGEEEKFQARKLEVGDKSKGFIELLQQLTVCGSISDQEFQARFQELTSYGDDHVICVIEDNRCRKIIATGSVFIEKKFIRNCGKVGHIEDVVVDSGARGMQLGKKIVGFLSEHACSVGCYKVILDCSADNLAFYEKCGFKQKERQMAKYFT